MLLLKILLALFFSSSTWAALQLPQQLSAQDRRDVLRILGFGSSSKLLSNPYPMGGYQGFELGMSSSVINIEDLSSKGAGTEEQENLLVNQLFIGKGLYRDVDIGFEFTPGMNPDELQSFGFQVRGILKKEEDSPMTLSVFFFTSNTNVKNQLRADSVGLDLVGAIHSESVSMYVGGGENRTFGKFTGGSNGLTDTNESETTVIRSLHSFIGASIQFKPYFLAFQMDRHDQLTYSAKLGARF